MNNIWVTYAYYHIKTALRNLVTYPLLSLVTILTLAIALLVVGLSALLVLKTNKLLSAVSGAYRMTIYLDPSVTPEAALELGRVVKQEWPQVNSVTVHSAEEDRKRNLALLPSDMAQTLDPDLIPAQPYLEVVIDVSKISPKEIDAITAWFKSLNQVQGVDEIIMGAENLKLAYGIVDAVRRTSTFVGTVLVIAALFFVLTTIRLTVHSRREEIEILLLLGATKNFIRIPHYIEGVVHGFGGGILAYIALVALQSHINNTLKTESLLASGLHFVTPAAGVWLVLGGIVLGFCGSLLAVARYLTLTNRSK